MMNCFPCFSSQKSGKSPSKNDHESNDNNVIEPRPPGNKVETEHAEKVNANVKTFTFRELATATRNFRQECLLGEGGFGRVYKGTLQSTGQVVAVKQLDKHGLHDGNKEFQAEVSSLCQLDHPNLVKLIGYCADGDQRLLVYDYVSGGSLEDHLHDPKPNQGPMDWITRMKIAFGAAQGLDYLHDKVNPPVVYRDLKASNILLDDEFSPKLCDIGLHKLGPGTGEKTSLSSRVMGTYGYCAPEYSRGGSLTIKADVYSFGVVLLELITGRKAVDTTKPHDEQNLVAWAQPIFRDPKRYPDMADPLLKKKFSERGLNQAVAIASMCVQEEAAARPLISDVMVALSFLSMSTEDGIPTAVPILSFRDKSMSLALSRHGSCSVTPHYPPDDSAKEDKSSDSDKESSVHEENTQSVIKHKDDHSATESDSDSDSESEDEHEDQEETSHLAKSGKSYYSSFGSERRSVDDKDAAHSLRIKYSYSSEEENGRLSNKSSQKSNDESPSSQYDSDKDDSLRNASGRTNSSIPRDDEHPQLGHSHGSKSDHQSVYSDDDSGEEGASLRRSES